jgi:hypothetical protein
MPLTLIKEDGTGKPDANSYASAADGDAYHDGHLYALAWTGASTGNKEKALVMATRLIDSHTQFLGFRRLSTQALQWPRINVRDPDIDGLYQFVAENVVPKLVIDATCEQARELLIADRTAAPLGEGLSFSSVSGTSFTYDKADRPPVLSHIAQALLSKLAASFANAHSVRLVRT